MYLFASKKSAVVAAVIGGFVLGFAIGRSNTSRSNSTDDQPTIAQLQNELGLEKKFHEQDQKDWAAADSSFLERSTYFKADPRNIVSGIQSKYATSTPYYASGVARIETNLGAKVEMGIKNGQITTGYVYFYDSKREHGLDVAKLVAGYLVGAGDSARDVIGFASYYSGPGVVLLRYPRGVIGTVTKDGRTTVTITPIAF